MKQFSLIAIMLVLLYPLYGQNENGSNGESEKNQHTKLPSIGGGAGILSFHGDVGTDKNLSPFSNFRQAGHMFVEQRFFNYFGIQLQGMYGKLSRNERSVQLNRNFETSMLAVDLNLVLHLDRGLINILLFKAKEQSFSPYISGGISYLKFQPFSDLKDAKGRNYFYWPSGIIADVPPPGSNGDIDTLQRDYTYETAIDSGRTSSLAIPLTLGFKYNLSRRVDVNIQATYYFSMTDYIDGYDIGRKGNDKFLHAGISINYNLGAKSYADLHGDEEWDVTNLDTSDTDNDGVIDVDDHCANTPKGVAVDIMGCPLDDDKDGIPNYLDQEPNTEPGKPVDTEGKTITEERWKEKLEQDIILLTVGEKPKEEWPIYVVDPETGVTKSPEGEEILPSYKEKPTLKEEYRQFDLNRDNEISIQELYNALDKALTGEVSIELFYELVDFFFEQ